MDPSEVGGADLEDDNDGTANDQYKEGGVAVLDPADREFLTEENAGREDHERSQRKVE